MNKGRTVFSQLTSFLPKKEFDKCVTRYKGNYRVRSFTCWDQFLCMLFAQLTYRESLRDIEACLRISRKRLYHMGIRGTISRSTLSDANDKRDWRIYRDFALSLIRRAQKLYESESFSVDLEQVVYALDASIIDLCLSVFPWATFRTTKAGVKLHTLLNLRGNIPNFVYITGANCPDMTVLDLVNKEPGAIYVMDKGYVDCKRLFHFNAAGAWFITRIKKNMPHRRVSSREVDKTTGLRCDQIVWLTGCNAKKDYPQQIRRIRFYDEKKKRTLIFITNNFSLPALTITQLYKSRWQVELFFKWIKQHLRIKAFYGTSENAVKTQIFIAISTYLLIAIIKKTLNLENSPYTMLQVSSVSLFEKMPIFQVFSQNLDLVETEDSTNQLKLF